MAQKEITSFSVSHSVCFFHFAQQSPQQLSPCIQDMDGYTSYWVGFIISTEN